MAQYSLSYDRCIGRPAWPEMRILTTAARTGTDLGVPKLHYLEIIRTTRGDRLQSILNPTIDRHVIRC